MTIRFRSHWGHFFLFCRFFFFYSPFYFLFVSFFIFPYPFLFNSFLFSFFFYVIKNFMLLSKFTTASMQIKKNSHKNDMSYQNMRIFKKLLFFSQKINFSMKNAIFLNFFNRTICYTQEKSCSSRFEPFFRPIMYLIKSFLVKVMALAR